MIRTYYNLFTKFTREFLVALMLVEHYLSRILSRTLSSRSRKVQTNLNQNQCFHVKTKELELRTKPRQSRFFGGRLSSLQNAFNQPLNHLTHI